MFPLFFWCVLPPPICLSTMGETFGDKIDILAVLAVTQWALQRSLSLSRYTHCVRHGKRQDTIRVCGFPFFFLYCGFTLFLWLKNKMASDCKLLSISMVFLPFLPFPSWPYQTYRDIHLETFHCRLWIRRRSLPPRDFYPSWIVVRLDWHRL